MRQQLLIDEGWWQVVQEGRRPGLHIACLEAGIGPQCAKKLSKNAPQWDEAQMLHGRCKYGDVLRELSVPFHVQVLIPTAPEVQAKWRSMWPLEPLWECGCRAPQLSSEAATTEVKSSCLTAEDGVILSHWRYNWNGYAPTPNSTLFQVASGPWNLHLTTLHYEVLAFS